MGLFTTLSLDEARRLGAEFGVRVDRVEPLRAGSVNSNYRVTDVTGKSYFARLYEEQGFAGRDRELELLRQLERQGVPTARPLERIAGGKSESAASHAGKPFAMYPWIDGEILCQARVTEAHTEKVGAALAAIHAASPAIDVELGEGRFRVEDMMVRLDRVDRETSEYGAAPAVIREQLERYGTRRNAALPSGVVHGDLFRDNVLWQGSDIAALIDFESAAHGLFCFDVAVTLFAWCYGSAFSIPLVRAFLRGYVSRRRLERAELEGFRVEGAIACLRFATTRITDFSMRAPPGEPPARDYRRFLARLDALENGELDAELEAVGS
jgi:homoserine kinase type II